jgi:hypothetical protein
VQVAGHADKSLQELVQERRRVLALHGLPSAGQNHDRWNQDAHVTAGALVPEDAAGVSSPQKRQRNLCNRDKGEDVGSGDELVVSARAGGAGAKLSAREQNQLKRMKRTQSAKADTMSRAHSVAAPAQLSSAREAELDTEDAELVANSGWPLQRLVGHLLLDLLSAYWEVRHGAALALQQIVHGCRISPGALRVQCSSTVLSVVVYLVGSTGVAQITRRQVSSWSMQLDA